MAKAITVRLTDEQAAALVARKKNTLVPTEAFIRRAIDRALEQPVFEAEPAQKPLDRYYRPAPLLIPQEPRS